MPKCLDFKSKTLHHGLCEVQDTHTENPLKYYEGVEEEYLVYMILLWMGPDALVKHTNHPIADGDAKKKEPLWTFLT